MQIILILKIIRSYLNIFVYSMYSFFTDKADIYRISRDENGKTEETLSGSVSGFLKAISLVQVQLGNGTF